MKIKNILLIFIVQLLTTSVFSQQSFCVDSSFRIKYIFGTNGATLYNNPDTVGTNMFTGSFVESSNKGIALLKTNWGDSMLWAKKIYINGGSFYNTNDIDGSVICSGFYGTAPNLELLICKFDAIGSPKWIKHFRLSTGHLTYNGTNRQQLKNITIANNAIYFNGVFRTITGAYNVIAKFDLDGSLIWSKGFSVNLPKATEVFNAPVFLNNTVIFAANVYELLPTSNYSVYSSLTRLNDADGNLIESNAYKLSPNPLHYGIIPYLLNANADSTFSLMGSLSISDLSGGFGYSDIIYNSRFDKDLNPLSNFYYKNNIPLYGAEYQFHFNHLKQHSILAPDLYNQNNKYFITFDKNDKVIRSRKFEINGALASLNNRFVDLDDKQNLHFLYHYLETGKEVTEYARISNLAPNGTLGCFGKDTSILTSNSFDLTKEPFVWDNIVTDLIFGEDVPYTEDTALVTKQVICKIVSRCDSIHIKGPSAVCVNQPVRYSIFKNNSCYKNLDWLIDTTAAHIISTEGDSAITISFKKAFSGYIHAAITDCVVKDSFFVQAVTPVYRPVINHTDSVLCPGKTLVLSANSGFTHYLWQGGFAGTQLTVSNAGLYKITATDSCGNTKADSIMVVAADTSLILLPLTQTICLYDTAFIQLPANVNNITWQPNTNSLLRNNTLVAYPTQSTVYSISAEHLQNCAVTKTAVVTIKICPQTAFIPNAFSPDKNGLNDVFKPVFSQPLATYQLVIYNRYGQAIFKTTQQYSGWDGTYKGSRQPMGGYTYTCKYRFAGKAEKTVSGYFMLVR